ncbi:hypothetical protein ZORO111903_06295 [Zobellia roscoffensis]|uniref:hypothetical protein n=1 Tax=Zobellia roscoffensis TaxID=2779508 RepID=UPI00188AC8FF|nr:hypothetical protein [Zobellia roscoffensis]
MNTFRMSLNHYRTNLLLLGLNLHLPVSNKATNKKIKKNDQSISGEIVLSGKETTNLGTSLKIGNLAIGRSNHRVKGKTIILTDSHTKINENGPIPNDHQNNFIIIGLDIEGPTRHNTSRSLTMNITVDGIEYKHTCTPPDFSTYKNYSSDFEIDFDKKEIVFTETNITNTVTDAVLTMNGTITWK